MDASSRSPSSRLPRIDTEKCTHCLHCLSVCPEGAIEDCKNSSCSKCVKYCTSMEVPCKPGSLTIKVELCNACGCCVEACPTKAIAWAV